MSEENKGNDVLETTLEKEEITSTPDEITDEAKRDVLVGWGLYVLGMFTGLFYIIAFVWALCQKNSKNTIFEESHYKAMTSMFLWSLVFYIIGLVLTLFFGLGLLIIFAIYVWNGIRIIRGILSAIDKTPYPVNK